MSERVPIEKVSVEAFRIPTESLESDGTLEWGATVMVLVTIRAGGNEGIGYSYTGRAAASVVEDRLADELEGMNALATRACWHGMVHAVRNVGRTGVVSSAIAACDVALHDLKAKLLGISAATLLGQRHDSVVIYGSGGFTSQTDEELAAQLGGWAEDGLLAVKMKIGRDPARDPERLRVARDAIGPDVQLFIDANGAFTRREALSFANLAAEYGVTWFEEPVSQSNLEGLRFVRERLPVGMEVSAGEYAWKLADFRQLLDARAVDVLQADATRCAGYTEFLMADALAAAHELPLSSHTAPALHLPAACAALQFRNVEWFADHVRIEAMFFDGVPQPKDGRIAPDLTRPGLGLELKRENAEHYAI